MSVEDDATLIDVLDRLRNRFFGKYRGVVTDVDAKTLRIKPVFQRYWRTSRRVGAGPVCPLQATIWGSPSCPK